VGGNPDRRAYAPLKDESGATMIEYGPVAALVSVAAIIALQILGGQLPGDRGGGS